MIAKLGKWSFSLLTYVCIGTVITQAILLGVIGIKGGLRHEKRLRLWAHLNGVDPAEIRQQEMSNIQDERAATEDQENEAPLVALREEALGVGLTQVRNIETRISSERQRYDKIRDIFDSRLEDLERNKVMASRETVQKTLEVIDTGLAKDLILQIMEEGGVEDATVVMVRMPSDRQRKIFAEFTSPEEVRKMNEILMFLRKGSLQSNPQESTP